MANGDWYWTWPAVIGRAVTALLQELSWDKQAKRKREELRRRKAEDDELLRKLKERNKGS